MNWAIDTINVLHVTAGFLGLAAFWVPVFARKGGPLHRAAGKVFKFSAYFVLAAAGTTISLRLGTLLTAGEGPSDNPNLWATLVFLGYLTVVTFIILRHGVTVLRHKDLVSMDTPLNNALAWVAIGASASLVAYSLVMKPGAAIVFYALSPIGVLSGMGIRKAIKGRVQGKRGWFYEHLGAMLGAGIAFHTAFAVFGANRLFSLGLEGWLAVVPWVLPAAIGIPATALWEKRYRRRFGDLPA